MCKGFMILPREIRRWGWYRNSKMIHMLIHLMLEAKYQDGSYMGIEIKRGQLATGRKQLAAETGMTEREVRTCLERLENDQQIVIKTTNKFSVITLCNYDSWQGVQKTNDQQTTNKTHKNDQQSDTSNDHIQINNNKDNKETKEDTNVSEKREPVTELEKDFESFRRKYKEFGGNARGFVTEFENLKKKHKDWKDVIPMLMYCLNKENDLRTEAQRHGEFFPQMKNLQTYINQRSWEAYSEGWESYDPDAYHPEGFPYDSEFDAYRFCDYIPNHDLLDGYTDDNRPDGARIVEQINVWVWSREQRRWNRE